MPPSGSEHRTAAMEKLGSCGLPLPAEIKGTSSWRCLGKFLSTFLAFLPSLCTSQLCNYTSPDHGCFSEVIPPPRYPQHQRAAEVLKHKLQKHPPSQQQHLYDDQMGLRQRFVMPRQYQFIAKVVAKRCDYDSTKTVQWLLLSSTAGGCSDPFV